MTSVIFINHPPKLKEKKLLELAENKKGGGDRILIEPLLILLKLLKTIQPT